jgi:RHS repeat-associated protein
VNSSGASASGSSETVLTLPPVPNGLSTTNIQRTGFTANWGITLSATSYLLDVAKDAGFTEFLSGYNGLSLTTTTKTVTGLNNSTTYFWRVRAINASGPSGNSQQNTTTLSQFAGQNENYIVAHEALVDGILPGTALDALPRESLSQTVQYFDGLGRPIQTVSTQGSPIKQDIVQPMAYDQFGRETIKYLPYISGNDGWFKTNFLPKENGNYATATSPQYQFYQSTTSKIAIDTRPFSETLVEPSPLNRPLQDFGPGNNWFANNKFVKHDYLVNVDGTLAGQEKIISWGVTSVTLNSQTVFLVSGSTSYFASGMLTIKSTTDEQGHAVREYVDKQGKTILKKVQVDDTPDTFTDADWAMTYYVYDDFDRQRFVLPPEFNTKIATYAAATDQIKSDMLNDWAFQTQYDERGRPIVNQVPGKKAVELVYDQWDRPVLSRDGNQLASGKWSFTKYDVLNRPIITGEISSANTRTQMVDAVNAITPRNEVTATGSVGYTLNQTYPTSAAIGDVYSITFYDDYVAFNQSLPSGTSYPFLPINGYAQTNNDRVRGKPTATKVRILGSANFLCTVTYYDDRYRVIQTVGNDHLNNTNWSTNAYYGITGLVTKSLFQHGSVLTMLAETDYDHKGRPLKTYLTLDSSPRIITSAFEYNELGQLVDKKLHSTDAGINYLQSVDFRYNIRGWLSSINNGQLSIDNANDDSNDLFGMNLNYEQPVAINGVNTTGQYNGNISSISWSTKNLVDAPNQKIYGYSYDNLNRLTLAGYAKKGTSSLWDTDVDMFNEALTYDKNGNILSLNRTSLYAGAKTNIDQMTYNYAKGNQLNYVNDGSLYWSKNDNNPDYGFAELTNLTTAEYTYDANGNMITDLNKGITAMAYNYLNKPTTVTLGAGTIYFTYDATGTKLKKVAGPATSDYVGPIQYENNKLAFIMLPEGRAVKTGTGWNYEYFHKDHLGNTRVVFGYENIVDEYMATMENARAGIEESTFRNIASSRVIDASKNRTPKSSITPIPDRAAETNGFKIISGTINKAIGPAKLLQVHTGDTVNISAYAKYTTSTSNNTVINNLVAMVTGTFGIVSGETSYTALGSNLPGISSGITRSTGAPKAYLIYILFKSDYSGVAQVGFAKVSNLALNAFQKLSLNLTIPSDYDGGYLYTYVVNESKISNTTSVYFDDVSVRHWQTAQALQVAQVNEYYPFGLAINPLAYNRNSVGKNDYLYNGKELQDDFGLGWEDYGARMYDPALGRWSSVDPMAEKMRRHSPYNYAFDNPVMFIDPDGMEPYSDAQFEAFQEENRKWEEQIQSEENNRTGIYGQDSKFEDLSQGNEDEERQKEPIPTFEVLYSTTDNPGLDVFRETTIISTNTGSITIQDDVMLLYNGQGQLKSFWSRRTTTQSFENDSPKGFTKDGILLEKDPIVNYSTPNYSKQMLGCMLASVAIHNGGELPRNVLQIWDRFIWSQKDKPPKNRSKAGGHKERNRKK